MSRIRSFRAAIAVAGSAVLAVALAAPAGAVTAAPKPAVTKVAPAYGPSAGGSRVTVTGKNFGKVKAVTFGGTTGRAVKVLSRSSLQVTAPRRAAGYADIRVKTSAGWSKVTRADRFRFVAAPTVRTLSVATGSTAGGGSVTVTGGNFVAVRSVVFGTVRSAKITVRSERSLVARVPRGKAGVVHVRVVSAAGTSPAVAADRYTYRVWGSAQFPSPRLGGIGGISCPTNDFCAAVDDQGAAVVYSSGAWSAPKLIDPPAPGNSFAYGLFAVSCVNATFCLAGGRSGVPFRWDGTTWTKTVADIDGSIGSIGCLSTTACLLTSSDPEGSRDDELWRYDGTTWTQDDTFSGGDVACTPGVSCHLLRDEEFARWDGTTWQFETEPPADVRFNGFACPSDTTCIGVTSEAKSYRFANGLWTGPASIPANDEDGYVLGIECTSTSHCVTDDGIDAFTYDGATWTKTASSLEPNVIVCSPVACSVSDGESVAALEPGAPAAAEGVDPNTGGVNDLDCGAVDACVAVGDNGRIAILQGTTWTTTASEVTADLTAVSCPTAKSCLAVGESGAVEKYDGSVWSAVGNVPAATRADGFQAVSCASSTYCVAMNGDLAWEYASGTWTSHRVTTTDHGTAHVDCTAPSFCAVFVANRFATVSNRKWTATKTVAAVDGDDVALACGSPTMCIGVSNGSTAFRWNGTSWAKSTKLLNYGNGYGWDVSCPSTSTCKVSTGGYNGPSDYVASGVWSYDAGSWTAMQQIAIAPDRVSCASATFCVAADTAGYVQTYR